MQIPKNVCENNRKLSRAPVPVKLAAVLLFEDARKLVALAGNDHQVVVGQPAPRLFHFALDLLPSAYDLSQFMAFHLAKSLWSEHVCATYRCLVVAAFGHDGVSMG